MFADAQGRNFLLLQGPMGPFFRRVADKLLARGANVTKVNFNLGDDTYYRGGDIVRFRGSLDEWKPYLLSLLQQRKIDRIVLFGDCRPLHKVARAVAAEQKVELWVFEEGYLRPDYVTLERDGVNGHSKLPKDPAYYGAITPEPLPPVHPVGKTFGLSAFYAISYAFLKTLGTPLYPHYRHHRNVNFIVQGWLWTVAGARRLLNRERDGLVQEQLERRSMPPFFLVALQVHLDSQMEHCGFADIRDFIEQVVTSFAQFAPPDVTLLVKHHPADLPYRDYTAQLDGLREHLELGHRLVYVDAVDIRLAVRAARGCVVINSTVGLSAIHHGTPTICLGTSIYDLAGLTHQGSLEEFWTKPAPVDSSLYQRFRYWLRRETQLNGNVWKDVYLPPSE